MGSSRLPGKVLRTIHSRTLLEHVLFRLEHLSHPAIIVVATTELDRDDAIEALCVEGNIRCFRGSDENVLQRYYLCARHYGFSHILRLTADNPFTDIVELDRLIKLHLADGNDFSHSFASLPIGVGAEIFTFQALEDSYQNGQEAHHIEHVDEYMLENPDRFRTGELIVTGDKNIPDVRLTIDTEDDYRQACYIVENASNDFVSTEEAVRLCMQFV